MHPLPLFGDVYVFIIAVCFDSDDAEANFTAKPMERREERCKLTQRRFKVQTELRGKIVNA